MFLVFVLLAAPAEDSIPLPAGRLTFCGMIRLATSTEAADVPITDVQEAPSKPTSRPFSLLIIAGPLDVLDRERGGWQSGMLRAVRTPLPEC